MEYIFSPYQRFSCEADQDSDYDEWEEHIYDLFNLYHDEDLEADKPIDLNAYKEISRDNINNNGR